MLTKTDNVTDVRDDFIPAADYISQSFFEKEADRLWPRAWQMVCREEELAQTGDFVTYDIVEESITVLRSAPDKISAYYNVCPHRGRRLTKGCGRLGKLHCRYHGWQWNLDGKSAVVIDRDDWGSVLNDDEVALKNVRVESWGGWVFINMDEDAVSLIEWLGTVAEIIAPFEPGRMRYKWRRQVVLPTNWKVALEAFNEGYHVQTTHRQLLTWTSDYTYSAKHGLHGMFGYAPGRSFGFPSPRLGSTEEIDQRQAIINFYEELLATLDTTMTNHTLSAAKRLLAEIPADTPPREVMQHFMRLNREEHENAGGGWPASLTGEQLVNAGTSWHVFPNMVFLHGATYLLGYRARPNGTDLNSCIFDVYALERFAEGAEPKPELVVSDNPADMKTWGLILTQDFENMADLQAGMKSRGFAGSRTNPKQELAVSNFHRALHEFIG